MYLNSCLKKPSLCKLLQIKEKLNLCDIFISQTFQNTQKFLAQSAQTIPLFYVHFKTLISVQEDQVFGNLVTP